MTLQTTISVLILCCSSSAVQHCQANAHTSSLSFNLQVALEHGVNFDEDELNAMMEVAASITQRASTSNMTFQGFQKLIQNLSTVT